MMLVGIPGATDPLDWNKGEKDMKTRVCLVAVIGMLFVMAGCATPATPPPPTQVPPTPANPADDPNAKVVLDMVW